MCDFGDFDDLEVDEGDLLNATQLTEQLFCEEEVTDFELVSSAEAVSSSKAVGLTAARQFQAPLSSDGLKELTSSRFPTKTVDNATWAVTAFGEWRAHQNSLCLQNPQDNLVYLNK